MTDNELMHYGTPRHSGRYPWGSGKDPYQSGAGLLSHIEYMRSEGLSDTQIAKGLGMSTTEFRRQRSIARNAKRQADMGMAQRLKDKGYSNVAIGKRMDIGESQVRALLNPANVDRANIQSEVTNLLRKEVADKKYIDVGAGVERHLNISHDKLQTAVTALQNEGYKKMYVKVPQLGTNHETTVQVLVPPGTEYADLYNARGEIKQISAVKSVSQDGGRSFLKMQDPISIDSNRVQVKYVDDGGAEADGVVYVRPGVSDVSIGANRYAQVRILVDNTHYIKGMAIYGDKFPPGVDLIFNSNKDRTPNKLDALKPLKDDPDLPFGSIVRQIQTPDGKVTSAMNIVNDEGQWGEWSKTMSSQMLSKQRNQLAKEQLGKVLADKRAEFDEINSLTNPVVRQTLLEGFADDVDAAAVHLKAAAMPRQATRVILPVNTLKDTEIYAPGFRDGERVALVRYPHGGIFEIPELTVNNRHPGGRKLLGNDARDAVGINSKVAERLSGADFDGDTVLVIPNNKGQIKTAPALEGLKNFDPVRAYPAYDGMRRMTTQQTGVEMGKVSNLITDMTIKGANHNEIARAVRHSMVVIDAEKKNLNFRQSEIDNGIAALRNKYQDGGGASTLISRARSTARVNEIVPRPARDGGPVDPKTGALVFVETGRSYVNKKGVTVRNVTRGPALSLTRDARTLSSGTAIEEVYAAHSNNLKGLANEARRAAVNTKAPLQSKSAREAYSSEVASLQAKLNTALKNAPLERQAQIVANSTYNAKLSANPNMEGAEKKKLKGLAQQDARNRLGAGKQRIDVTEEEWNAIQAGAVSSSQLKEILRHADIDVIKKYATPRTSVTLPTVQLGRARTLMEAGYTLAEVADALGVSTSALNKALYG